MRALQRASAVLSQTALADFLDQRREEILARWEACAREVAFGDELSRSVVRNHVPELLEGMAKALRHQGSQGIAAATPDEIVKPARAHGRQRFRRGIDVQLVQNEYRALRDVIFDLLEEAGYRPRLDEVRVVGDVITAAICEALREFAAERAQVTTDTRKLADEREAQFRVLADSIPQLVWMADADGSATWFNQRWYDYTGKSFDEVKGWAWLKVVHPDHVEAASARYRESFAAGEPWEDTYPLRSKSGEYRRFLSRALPLRDPQGKVVRWFGTNTDIEDHLRAEEKLTRFFSLVPDMLSIADLEGRFLRVNPAFEETLGWSEKELLSRPFLDFVHPDDREKTMAQLADVVRGVSTRRFENRYRTRSGEYRTLSWATSPMPEQGLTLGVARDITEEKLEAEFRERFFGIIAHDLRVPLTAIRTGASLLFRFDDMPEGALRVARRISSATERMSGMISELLDFTRARIGPGVLIQRERADFTEIVERAVEEVNVAYPTRIIQLEAEHGLFGDWDAARLARVTANLVKNALDYGPADKPVHVLVRRSGDGVVLRVRNPNVAGPIPEKDLPTLFDPFRRVSETGARAREGLGLGLYITREIVLAHGGSIEVTSVPEGTTFTVRLPFAYEKSR